MARVYNFSAGPSMLPEAVLKTAADEMLDYQGSGQSVMEMSHRSKTYDKIIKDAEALLREIMNIPDNYKVMFLQGGGSTQFAMVALNFMNKNNKADYIITGQWAKKLTKRLLVMATLRLLLLRRIKLSLIFLRQISQCSERTLTMYIFV